MPISFRNFTAAWLNLKVNTQGSKSTVFANMKKDVVLKALDVLGYSCGDFQSNMTLKNAMTQGAKVARLPHTGQERASTWLRVASTSL